MTRAKRNISEDVKLVDVIIEILDARIPNSSENPDIKKLTKGKNRVILLNKSDLADENATASWIRYFKENGAECVAMDSRSRDSLSSLKQALRKISKEKRERDLRRGMTKERPLKIMVAGIPNVGKSTLINTLTGRATAKTGNKPGVTKGNQWVSAENNILLLDTPGILWPKFEDPTVGMNLASIGSINDDILDKNEVAVFLSRKLLDNYQEEYFGRYGFTMEDIEKETENLPDIPGLDKEALASLNLVAYRRNCIKKGAEPDYEKASKMLIDDLRAGRLGRISLERPV